MLNSEVFADVIYVLLEELSVLLHVHWIENPGKMIVHALGILWMCSVPPTHEGRSTFDRKVAAVDENKWFTGIIHDLLSCLMLKVLI